MSQAGLNGFNYWLDTPLAAATAAPAQPAGGTQSGFSGAGSTLVHAHPEGHSWPPAQALLQK
jgi:hypothetical protein